MPKPESEALRRLQIRREFTERLKNIEPEVLTEIVRGQALHGDILSLREGWGILSEEFDELWEAIKADDPVGVREESVHVAAVALRIVLDVVDGNYDKEDGGMR